MKKLTDDYCCSNKTMNCRTPAVTLLESAHQRPDEVAMIFGDEKWTNAQLARDSLQLASAFESKGFERGDLVALHMFNSPELVSTYYACFLSGLIAVPLNSRFRPPEIKGVLARVEPDLYLGQSELYGQDLCFDGTSLTPENRFIIGSENPVGASPWSDLFSSGAPSQTMPDVEPDVPAILLATSGTTGESKLVVLTHRTLANFTLSADDRGYFPGAVFCIATSMMHASGVYAMINTLLHGGTIVVLPKFDPEVMLDTFETHRCTTMWGFPSMCAELCRAQRERPRDISSLRTCRVAGDSCPVEIQEQFKLVMNRDLLSLWASTEDIGAMGSGKTAGPFTQPLAQTEVRLIGDEGVLVADGETGEAVVRSPSTSPGYWIERGVVEPFRDGWFHSGDLMQRQPDGQLRYMGRKKDLIIRGGSNISPLEVEAVMRNHPSVADVAVVGLPDPELNERVGAAVVLAPGTNSKIFPDLIAWTADQIAAYKVPEQLVAVESIARNANTKVDRLAVASQIMNQTA